MDPDTLSHVVEWAWVGGYTTLSTLVVIFNLLIFFSVIMNKFCHYGFHYVVLALSLSNLCRVSHTLWLVFLAKFVQLPWLLKATIPEISEEDLDLTQAASMPLMCEILSMTDHFLMITLMFYLASLSLYMFSRDPNPPISAISQSTSKLYGLNDGLVPVKESGWVSFTLLLLPPFLAALLCLPVAVLHFTHPLIAVPGGLICNVPSTMQFNIYKLSVAALGFCVPVAVVILLMLALSVRRCLSCFHGSCVSSFCKEEMSLAFLTLPYTLVYIAMYIPLVDHCLDSLNMPETGLQPYLLPEAARALEMIMGLLLPIVVYTFLPAYRQFSSEPDKADLRRSKISMDSVIHSRRSSEASLDIFKGGLA